MKNIALVLTILVNIIMSASCENNSDSPEKGLLWEISGNGLTQKSYLFGTWHGSTGVCVDFLDSIPRFYEVFNSVSQYAGENVGGENIDGKNVFEVLKEPLGEIFLPQEVRYNNLLNETDIQYLDSLLLKYLGTTSSEMNLRPNHLFFILSMIISDKPYLEAENEICKVKMDNYLIRRAKEKNDTLIGLDSQEVMKKAMMEIFFRNYNPGTTLKENADALMKGLKGMLAQEENADLKLNTMKMENAYRSMDLKNLVKFKNESIQIVKELLLENSDFDESYRFLLVGRNKLWMEKIPALINDKPTFIAVGALHLCGKQGLIQLLRRKGYIVKPVN